MIILFVYPYSLIYLKIINLSHDGHTRVGVLCTDGMLHILLLLTHVPQQWDRVVSIATELDVSVYREVAYTRSFNSLFWPLPNGDDYAIVMYDIETRQARTMLTRVKSCTLQVISRRTPQCVLVQSISINCTGASRNQR